MIIGIGVDICDISRFADVTHRSSPLFYERLLSQTEYQYFKDIQNKEERIRWLTCVFVTKEAVLKACGTGIDGRFSLNMISTFHTSSHRWQVCLPALLLESLGEGVKCHLSHSFSKTQAIAFAVLEK